MENKYRENIEGKGELSVRVITAETAAVNDRRNTAPEFPMYECPPKLLSAEIQQFRMAFQLTKA